MEVANFLCKSVIGDVELLDIFDAYVFPAMLNQEVMGSKNSETLSYKFIDLKISKIDNQLLLSGRLVKKLNLKRQQILEGDSLVQSYDSMESAPSSFFVLILSNHKLLWVREVQRAPLLKDFKYAIKKMLTKQRSLLVNKYIVENSPKLFLGGDNRNEIERKAYSMYPDLDISVTQIGSNLQIKEKLAKFYKIHNIKLSALKRNNELGTDYSQLSKILSETQADMKAKNVVTEIKGGSLHPLNKDAVIRLVQASADGNYEYTIKGKDENNNDISESNETLSLATDIKYQDNDDSNAKIMLGKFMTITNNYNSLPRQLNDAQEKLKKIEQNHLKRGD